MFIFLVLNSFILVLEAKYVFRKCERGRICKRLRSQGKELIPPAYVAWGPVR